MKVKVSTKSQTHAPALAAGQHANLYATCRPMPEITMLVTSRSGGFLEDIQLNGHKICLLVAQCSNHTQSVSQGQICSNNSMCCHTETEIMDQTYNLALSQGQLVPALTSQCYVSGRQTTRSSNNHVTSMTPPESNSPTSHTHGEHLSTCLIKVVQEAKKQECTEKIQIQVPRKRQDRQVEP